MHPSSWAWQDMEDTCLNAMGRPKFPRAPGPAAGYDLYGRAVARHLGRFMPGNPTLLAQNMAGPGACALSGHGRSGQRRAPAKARTHMAQRPERTMSAAVNSITGTGRICALIRVRAG